MIPVNQTIFGKGKGNCFQACLASILEMPLDDVPHFCGNYGDGEWYSRVQDWLFKKYRLSLINLEFKDWDEAFGCVHGCYCILSGKSPRGDCEHAVVLFNGKIVHDPHPGPDKLEDYRSIDAFLAANPAQLVVADVATAPQIA